MKKQNIFKFVLTVVVMVLTAVCGSGYAMAEDPASIPPSSSGDGTSVQQLGGGKGTVVDGERSLTGDQNVIKDNEWFIKQVNQVIVEMKQCSAPIDQILRAGNVNKSDSIVVKYYSVGQRPLRTTVSEQFTSNTTGNISPIHVMDNGVIGEMDTLLVLNEDGSFVMSTAEGHTTEPLMLRVHAIDGTTNLPMVYAVNGTNNSTNKPFVIPNLQAGTILLRLGRAAAEKDVNTGSYYQMPEPTEQYCQRFIMQVEESVYTRFSKTELDWTFTRMERMAMEDMRIGMEASGLFGVKTKHIVNSQGLIYTTGGIYWMAGKDAILGHWEKVKNDDGSYATYTEGEKTYYVQEYVITENELIDLISYINEDAGNASRKKMVFVDNEIYSALCKIKTNNRVRLLEQKDNYMNLGLDFQSYSSMGTTLMFYRHDLFNAWGFNYRAFSLDAEYLDKWTFMNWAREEYDLQKLYIRNANAVTMQEFSCWTLSYPNAHARIGAPVATPIEVAA